VVFFLFFCRPAQAARYDKKARRGFRAGLALPTTATND
jgi:hypothetical protein